jgi:hypothetical protein
VARSYPLRWEIKYLAYPYASWSVEEFSTEGEARAAFARLWMMTPPTVNLSMRSTRLDLEQHDDDDSHEAIASADRDDGDEA